VLPAAVQGSQTGGRHDGRFIKSTTQARALHEPELYGLLRGRGGCQLLETIGPAVRQGGVQLKYEPPFRSIALSLGCFGLPFSRSVRFNSIRLMVFHFSEWLTRLRLFSSLPAH